MTDTTFASLSSADQIALAGFLDDEAGEPRSAESVAVLADIYSADAIGQQTFNEDFARWQASLNTAKPAKDTFTRDLIRESVTEARKAVRHSTAVNLGHAARLVKAIEHEIVKAANTLDDVKAIRSQTIGLFSGPLSRAEGRSITAKHLTEYVAILRLIECLPSDMQVTAKRVPWEALRTLARWSIHLHGENELTKHECYAETWQVLLGCKAKLTELIVHLAKHPASQSWLRSEMDKHEATLAGAAPVVPASHLAEMVKAMTTIRKIMKDRKIDSAGLLGWMIEDKIIDLKTFEAVVTSLLAPNANTVSKPASAATATLNDSGKPNENPLANAATRIVMQGTKRA